MNEPMSTEELLILSRARRMAKTGEARAVRLAACVTQTAVAESIGVSQSLFNHWEAGRRNPTGRAGIRYGRLLMAFEEKAR